MRYVIREKFFHIGEDSVITDETGAVRFQVDGKVLSLHNKLIIRDPSGAEVATVHRKLIALRPTYEVERHGQQAAELRKHFFTPFIDRYTLDVPGDNDFEVKGSLLEHEYTITQGGQVVATVSKRWIALTDTYGVDIAPGQDDVVVLASVLALDLAEDREREKHE
ncbi:MAG TPA: LURP-one-related family protein [Ktedonobacterales bacterium]|nr:LURP-one-related family protein [Ktedonobacterales bacterium]